MSNKLIGWIELVALNVVNISVINWLNDVIKVVPVFVSVLVGVSVLVLNGIKIYKELKNNGNSSDK